MKIYWTAGLTGNFTTPADWSTDTVPGPADTAELNASGDYVTLTSQSPITQTVLALTTAAGATFDVTGDATLTITDGTGTGTNAGTFLIGNYISVLCGGTFNNTGVIAIDEGTNTTNGAAMEVSQLGLTLIGGGQVILDGGQILSSSTAPLTNFNNTISGLSGGLGYLINENKGVVDANGDGNAIVCTSGGINSGILEATAGGTLSLYVSVTNTSSGIIRADGAGSTVELVQTPDIIGGTFETTNGGEILLGSGTLDGSLHSINNLGTIITNGADILLGTINNHGTIDVESSTLFVNATLTGDGDIILSSDGNNIVIADPHITGNSMLTNVNNVLSGAGEIGGAHFILNNQAKGMIDATDSNPLIIDTGSNVVKNAGTLEATSGGELFIGSSISNPGYLIANAGDLIVEGAVTGKGTATISGGGLLEFGATSAENTSFSGAGGTMVLDAAPNFTGKVTGYTVGDYFDLTDISFATSSLTYKSNAAHSGGTLTVTDGANIAHITLVGSYTQSSFATANDGGGGTLISDPPTTHGVAVVGTDIDPDAQSYNNNWFLVDGGADMFQESAASLLSKNLTDGFMANGDIGDTDHAFAASALPNFDAGMLADRLNAADAAGSISQLYAHRQFGTLGAFPDGGSGSLITDSPITHP